MKIKNMTASFLAALTLLSCGREELPEMPGDTEVTLHVGLASPQSKTWLDSQSEGSHKKVYWSDGDIINVNGRPSTPISIRGGQTISEADFFLRGVEAPYSVIYPHAAVVSGSASEGSGKTSTFLMESAWQPKLTRARHIPQRMETRISFQRTISTSLGSVSPMERLRITAVEDWLPELPPVPISMGIKAMSAACAARASSKDVKIMLVKVAESISSISQGRRFLKISVTGVLD